MSILSDTELSAALSDLPGWSCVDSHLEKTFTLDDFPQSVAFITRIAFAAEAAAHHPDLLIQYNRVTVRLSTHDAGTQVTQKDLKLARKIEDIVASGAPLAEG
jgi:4a-hydroxytetrahydrobiopterin dehydratase